MPDRNAFELAAERQQGLGGNNQRQISGNMLVPALIRPDIIPGFHGIHLNLGHFLRGFTGKNGRCQGFAVQIGPVLKLFSGKYAGHLKRNPPDLNDRGFRLIQRKSPAPAPCDRKSGPRLALRA